MPINLNSDKLTIVVKPLQQQLIYTGATTHLLNVGTGEEIYAGLQGTASKIRTLKAGQNISISTVGNEIVFDAMTGGTFQMIGSGDTNVTNISGNTWIVFSPSGVTGNFTPLSAFTSHTNDSTIHFKQSGITISESQVTNLVTHLSQKSGTGHTHTGVYSPTGHTHSQYSLTSHGHTTLTGLTISESQVTNLVSDLSNKSNTNHTHSYTGSSITNKPSFVGSGSTTVALVGNTYRIYSSGGTGGSQDWSSVTNKPSWLSGTTITAFQSAHQHTQYSLTGHNHTGVYSPVNHLHTGVYSPTGHTHSQYATIINLTGHTSDSSIHFKQSGITINESQVTNLVTDLAGKSGTGHTHSQYSLTSSINTYTGTTAPNAFATKTLSRGNVGNASYTLTAGSSDVMLEMTYAGNKTLILPTGLTQYMQLRVLNAGTGSLTFQAGANATIYSNLSDNTLNNQYAQAYLWHRGTGIWYVDGDMEDYATSSSINTYTGTTAPNTFASKSSIQTYTGTTAPAQFLPKLANLVIVTGTTDTIANTDGGTIIKYTNSSARTVTLPTGLTTNLQFTAINYGGTTTVTFAAGAGATLHTKNSMLKLATIYGAATWIYEGGNVWVGVGDLTT